MKRLASIILACAALLAFGEGDDSAVANRKWVRAQIANALGGVQTKPPSIETVGGSTTATSDLPEADDADALKSATVKVTAYAPTNAALFVAWTTEPRIPAYSYYAKIPGMNLYASTNAFLRTISFTVTNWTECATNSLGHEIHCDHQSTRWTATDANGGRWATAYMGGNTVLCCTADTSRYVVIQRSTVTDAAAKILRGSYGVAWNTATAPPFTFLSLLAPPALADHHVEVERGGGTLGYHEAVAIEYVDIADKTGTYVYRIPDDGRDHQYDPYGGVKHGDLNAGEAHYLSDGARTDPENWGFTFPLLVDVLDADGNPTGRQFKILKGQFMKSRAWLEACSVELPKANEKDEPEISDPSEHDCKVFDANGNHVGCVCDWRYCRFCPNCDSKYTITKYWSDGTVEKAEKEIRFAGAQHNAKGVMLLSDGNYYEDAGGCIVCWAGDNRNDGTHFCGDMDKNNLDGKAKSSHTRNWTEDTGREECGCACGKYRNSSTAIPQTMHNHPLSTDEGHGARSGQDSFCWCYCRRHHDGIIAPDDSDEMCPNHCTTCGAFKTVDGEEINGVHPQPLPYLLADGGGLPDIADHSPSGIHCGCKCGAVSPDSSETYELIEDAESFHVIDDEGCTCGCRRQMHKPRNETGHCTKICVLCGKKNGKNEKGQIVPVTPDWKDHTPSSEQCGCECYANQDGFTGNEGGKCGYRGDERGPANDAKWHKRKDAEHCCCGCGAYSDHAARSLSHADWFIEGEKCKAVCTGINAFGQTCGKIVNANRAAQWSEHEPAETGCGCKCGKFTGAESGMAGADEYHHRDGSSCHCVCQGNWSNHEAWMTAKGALPDICANVCVCGRYRDGTRPAAFMDHAGRVSGCGCKCGELDDNAMAVEFHNGRGTPSCRCECGKVHRWYDGSTARCQVCSVCKLTEDDREPTDEKLHRLDASGEAECKCHCGYFSPDANHASDAALHAWDAMTADEWGNGKCRCECGLKHRFRTASTRQKNQDKACPDVCAYCRELKEDGTNAQEDDHTPKDSGEQRCGCRCGKLDHGAKADKFHIRMADSCVCYGGDGKGGSHHFRHPKDGCQKVCAYMRDGHEHLVAAYDHDKSGIVDAQASDHTKDTGARCGCKCGKFANSSDAAELYGLHNQNPNACGCYCQKSTKDGHHRGSGSSCKCHCGSTLWMGSHIWGNDCLCLCPDKAHRPVHRADGACPGVCHGSCGESRRSALKQNHAPSSDRCGCECGAFGGSDYPDGKFHSPHGSPSCLCECGRYHNHSQARNDCTDICALCGDRKSNYAHKSPITYAPDTAHTWDQEHSCRCLCGKHTKHNYAADACTCHCGKEKRAHDYVKQSEVEASQFTCEKCGNYISVRQLEYLCRRCGQTDIKNVEKGHTVNCVNHVDAKLCGCGCMGCDCWACERGSGNCATCGNSCGDEKQDGVGGSGGQSGGVGGLEDI